MKRVPWNYMLPDCSILYIHTDGSVYASWALDAPIPRVVASYILRGARKVDKVLRYT